jgi:Tol biopolymer transport system component
VLPGGISLKRFILCLNNLLLMLMLVLVIGSKLIGQISPAPVLGSFEIRYPGALNRLRGLDTVRGTAYEHLFELPYHKWSGDYCHIALVHNPHVSGGEVSIVDISGGRWHSYRMEGRTMFESYIQFLNWSPDARFLAVGLISDENLPVVAVIDAQQATVRHIPVMSDRPDGWINFQGWSPDSTRLLYLGTDLYVLDVATGATRLLSEVERSGWQWSADGQYLSVTEESPRIVNSITGENFSLADRVKATIFAGGMGVWSPTGHTIAFAGKPADESTFDTGPYYGYRYDVDTGILTTLLMMNKAAGEPLLWSPDGRWLVFFSFTAETQITKIHLVNSVTGELLREVESEQFKNMVWSPDSRYFLTIGGFTGIDLRMADMQTGQLIEWQMPEPYMTGVQWFPDSRQFSFIARSVRSSDIYTARIDDGEIALTDRYQDTGLVAQLCFLEA